MNTLSGRIRLDFRSQEPIYLQIVRQVEKLVRDGILAPGDQLPTVRELAIDLRINFSTVARAYRILDDQKLISTQRGRGTYIWDEVEPETASTAPSSAALQAEQAASLARGFIAEARRLGLNLSDIERAFQLELAKVARQ